MGNCISKINKGHFYVYKEYMRNKTSLEKGKTRRALEMGTRGGTHMGVQALLTFSEIMTLAWLQTGMWWVRCINNNLRCTMK